MQVDRADAPAELGFGDDREQEIAEILDVEGSGYADFHRACRLRRLAALGQSSAQSEKLVPQPQLAVAFGLLILNDCPIRSSTKSICEPAM